MECFTKVNHIFSGNLYMVNHSEMVYNVSRKDVIPYMAPSEAQKKAAAKYQKENIASLACRVKKDQAEAFKAYCESLGKTSNAVLKEFVLSCIGSQSDEE